MEGSYLTEELETLKSIYTESELSITLTTEADGHQAIVKYLCSSRFAVKFTINDGYPQTLPLIEVTESDDKEKCNQLQSLLLKKANDLINEPMLYSLIDCVTSHCQDTLSVLMPIKDATPPPNVCSFYAKGNCKFGDRCFNLHVDRNNTIKSISGRSQEDATRKSIVAQREDTCASAKKKPMKTATDVIKRIKWDPNVSIGDFIVGYIDRFVGIVEKNFTEFSWEDLASVDYNVLAIPKHRIQYFKYKGVIVWDKRSRLDKVFGSTGDSERILNFENENVNQDSKTETPPIEIMMKEDENNDNKEIKIDSNPNRPNFFLCFKINDDKIKAKVKQAQEQVLTYDNRLEPTCLSVNVLHVTLLMFRLESSTEKDVAIGVLKQLNSILVSMIPSYKHFRLSGVDSFNDKVIYVKVEQDAALTKFAYIAMRKFEEAGIKLVGNYVPFTPHMTIMKLSRPHCREFKIDGFNRFSWQQIHNETFGNVSINDLYICSTGKHRGYDGFYIQLSCIRNLLTVIFPNVCNILMPKIVEYIKKSFITESEGDTFVDMFEDSSDNLNTQEEVLIKLQNALDLSMPEFTISEKRVLIMRGLPGSGKSYYVNNSICREKNNVVICSADTFFDGIREFDTSLLVEAHAHCRSQFINAITKDVDTIVVDNTNSQVWEYSLYKRLAVLFGYDYKVVEMKCEVDEIPLVSQRCLHSVSAERIKDMHSRWQTDPEAKIIKATIDGEIDVTEKAMLPDCVSDAMLEKCQPSVLYSAVFLDDQSKEQLQSCFPAHHKNVYGDHMTIQINPLSQTLRHIPIGQNMKMEVIGYVNNDIIQAVAVREIGERMATSNYPHVTLSTSAKALPRCAADALAANKSSSDLPLHVNGQTIVLSGVVGLKIASDEKTSIAITKASDFIEFILQVSLTSLDHSHQMVKKLQLKPLNRDEESKITDLYIFDFDGTLFNTPDPVEGRKIYKSATGHSWPHRSFLSQPKSLLHPLSVNPGPSFSDFVSHCHRSNSFTIVMTGRMERLRGSVRSVLSDFGFAPDKLILKPEDKDNGAKASYKGKVSSYKKAAITDLLAEFQNVKSVKFWDDRADNCRAIKDLASQKPNIKFDIIHVSENLKGVVKHTATLSDDTSSKANKGQLLPLLQKFNVTMAEDRKMVCGAAVELLSECWSKVLGFNAMCCVIPFGSFKLEFDGDLDVCLLAPKSLTVTKCMSMLSNELQQRGITYIYTAPRTRCPRMKVKLLYANERPVELDLSLVCCFSDAELTNEMDLESKIVQLYSKTENAIEKTVLVGPVFWLKLFKTLNKCNCDTSKFSLIASGVILFLKMQRLKGNAFGCIRTFQVISALKEIIKATSDVFNQLSLDESFVHVFNCLAQISLDKWKAICLDFVSDDQLIKLISALSAGDAICKQLHIADLFKFEEFPKLNQRIVSIKLATQSPLQHWLGTSFLHGKLNSICRQMTEANVTVTAGPIVSDNTYTFSIENSKPVEMNAHMYMNKLCKKLKENGFAVTYTIDNAF